MIEILKLFNKSFEQVYKDFKIIQGLVILIVLYDLLDSFVVTQILPKVTLDSLSSMYPFISVLIATYLGLLLYVKLIEISYGSKILLTKKIYLNYLWAAVLVAVGALMGFILLIVPGIIWLIFTTFSNLIIIKENLSAKKAIVKSFRIVKKNFKQVFMLGLFAFILMIPVVIYLIIILYQYLVVKDYVQNYLGFWQMFINFYSVFTGILISLTTINLYKKITPTTK